MTLDTMIRSANPADAPMMQTLLQHASDDWSPEILMSCFSQDYQQWVMSVDNQILGFVIIKKIWHDWEIMQFVIDKKSQRQGLGKRLLLFLIDQAKQQHVDNIFLEVRQSNHAAISLYQKCGFQKIALREAYYADGENAVVMSYA